MAAERLGSPRLLRQRLRTAVACVLCASLFSGCASAGFTHFPDVSDRVGAIMQINFYVGAELILLSQIIDAMDSTAEQDQELYNREFANWIFDHTRLANDGESWREISGDIRRSYDSLSTAGALSFATASEIEMAYLRANAQNQASVSLPGLYSAKYENRVEEWQNYLEGFLSVNRSEAQSIMKSQDWLKALKDSQDSLLPSRRQTLQSGPQIDNFINQELSRLRIDVQRYIDLEVKQALNEQQERFEIQAAFEGAVKTWQTAQQGSRAGGY